MKNSQDLGQTAERLTRALTGEVKVQGNFGELKLRQLLEDLGLKEGEQYTTQATLKDRFGKRIKDDEERALIPDFILHFPNNRDVIIDSKVNLTAYERYISEENQEEKSLHCREHIAAVRRQVDNLARKDYSRYLSTDFTKLNFVIMYMHNEGAMNLALLNDNSLWRYAYDKGVLIMGPQTMYMNLRVLELMWTQSRQLTNQQMIMEAAEEIVGRMQIFAKRFKEVDESLRKTTNCFEEIKKSTADSGQSVITSARKLIKAGVKEDKKKVSLSSVFMQEETQPMIGDLDDDSSSSQQISQLPDNEDEALKHLFKR
jgi:DNA recombination protein RmuC